MVRRQGLILVVALIAAGCPQRKPVAQKPAAGEPQVRATVVTIRTSVQPANKTLDHTLMIGNGRARSSDEIDAWRLIDLQKKQVTFVDDIAKTFRTVPLATLEKQHRAAYATSAGAELPRAQWVPSRATRAIAGVQATQALVRMGAYTRELWIGRHPSIPDELYAAMRASEPASSPIAGVARSVDDALLQLRGFPMAEHAELPFGNKKLVVDHTVVSVAQQNVAASMFNVPPSYKDVTPPPPAAPRPTTAPSTRKPR